jgi:antitoxin component YwqK of YwqJK toxin-antitoxin module
MNKSIILIFFLSLLSFSNAQFSENSIESFSEKRDTENSNANALATEPVTSLFLFSKDGKINEHLNGKILYDAHVKNRKLHGSWQSWYENGYLCDSGTFVKRIA